MKKLTSFYRRLIIAGSVLAFATMLVRCIEPYELPVGEADVNFLVVDGFMNTADGSLNVNLFRATTITTEGLPFEAGATVTLVDSDNNTYPLTALDSGRYRGSVPALDFMKQYQLYIRTANGKEYLSAFITLKPTPEIKEVGWRAYHDGTQIVVDTDDPGNTSRYYRWTFEETWEYHSRYISYWRPSGVDVDTIANDEAVPRLPEEMIDKCYRTVNSTRIFTATTTGFTSDIVNDYQLTFIPQGNVRLGYRYSILVKQYVISKETYEYLEKLKNTSQGQSGLYAPQPSTVQGNIRNIADGNEVVLGYFDAGQSTEKRLTIARQELPAHLRVEYRDNSIICYADTAKENFKAIVESGDFQLLYPIYDSDELFAPIAGYMYTSNECADCRLKGGITTKPSFWP